MNRPPCTELVLPPTSWFLQLGHPMPNSNPTHRPSVTGRAQKRKSPMMKLAILIPLGLHSNENCQEVNTTNLYIIWHFTSCIATQIRMKPHPACPHLPPQLAHLPHVSTRLGRTGNTWSQSEQCTELACRTGLLQRTNGCYRGHNCNKYTDSRRKVTK